MLSKLNFTKLILLIVFIGFSNLIPLVAQDGESSFNKICKACHTIGGGNLIGPDLKDVSKRKDGEWLHRFIKSSKEVINSGDEYAVALFEKFNKIPMPDVTLSDAEIKQVMAYIDEQSAKGPDATATAVAEVLTGNADNGLKLFTGEKALENGGPACISCHDVNYSDVDYGGKLAKDLSVSYGVLKAAGVKSVLSFLSFPAMANTYGTKALTETEIDDLTAFLKNVNDTSYSASAEKFDLMFFLYSLIFFIFILFFLHTFWKNKKPDSVKEHIYNR